MYPSHSRMAASDSFSFEPGIVTEIHLAGFDARGELLVDTHGAPVHAEVWMLYAFALERFGPRPTLIEWDTDIPAFGVLEHEARMAQQMMDVRHALVA